MNQALATPVHTHAAHLAVAKVPAEAKQLLSVYLADTHYQTKRLWIWGQHRLTPRNQAKLEPIEALLNRVCLWGSADKIDHVAHEISMHPQVSMLCWELPQKNAESIYATVKAYLSRLYDGIEVVERFEC